MMSRKTWTKALAKLEMLPLTTAVVAATISASSLMASAQESAPVAPASPAATLPAPNLPPLTSVNVAPAAPAGSTAQAAAPAAPSAPAAPAAVQPAPAASTAQAAPAASAPTPRPTEPYSLSVSQANQIVKGGLSLDVTHEDMNDPSSPIRAVTLRGKMHVECVDKFIITNSNQDSSIAITQPGGKYSFGFQIIDKGPGLECVKEHNKLPCTASSCVSISTLEGATLDTSNINVDGNIQLIYKNPEKDPDMVAENIGQAVKFDSPETIKKRELAKAEEERQKRVEANEDAFKNCRHSLEELSTASKALNALIRDTDMAFEDIKAKRADLAKARELLEKKQVQAEFNALRKRILKAKDGEEVESISDDLASFADDHPEFAKDVKHAQEELISAVGDNMGNDAESFALRKKIYSNLMGMDGVSAAEAKSYRAKMTGLDLAQQAAALQSGDFSSWNAQNYQRMAQQAQKDIQSNCRMTKSNSLSDACQQSMNNYKAFSQLQGVAITAQREQMQQQANMQMQMQSQFQQFMNNSMNVGNMGANGFANTNGFMNTNSFGQNGFSQSGFGQSGFGTNSPNMGMPMGMNMMGGARQF